MSNSQVKYDAVFLNQLYLNLNSTLVWKQIDLPMITLPFVPLCKLGREIGSGWAYLQYWNVDIFAEPLIMRLPLHPHTEPMVEFWCLHWVYGISSAASVLLTSLGTTCWHVRFQLHSPPSLVHVNHGWFRRLSHYDSGIKTFLPLNKKGKNMYLSRRSEGHLGPRIRLLVPVFGSAWRFDVTSKTHISTQQHRTYSAYAHKYISW